ncbi:MAG: hypothetical protein K5839_00665 [Treponemataceae bacterium]|nr:hypothetical protein [Treponemataceae bacterium]
MKIRFKELIKTLAANIMKRDVNLHKIFAESFKARQSKIFSFLNILKVKDGMKAIIKNGNDEKKYLKSRL